MKTVPEEIVVPKSKYQYSFPVLPVKIEVGPHGGVCDLYINGKLIENAHSYTLKVEGGKITTLSVEFSLIEGELEGILNQAGITIKDSEGKEHPINVLENNNSQESTAGHGTRAYRRSVTDYIISTQDAG